MNGTNASSVIIEDYIIITGVLQQLEIFLEILFPLLINDNHNIPTIVERKEGSELGTVEPSTSRPISTQVTVPSDHGMENQLCEDTIKWTKDKGKDGPLAQIDTNHYLHPRNE